MSERFFLLKLNFTSMREAAYRRIVKKRYWRETGLAGDSGHAGARTGCGTARGPRSRLQTRRPPTNRRAL